MNLQMLYHTIHYIDKDNTVTLDIELFRQIRENGSNL